MSTQTTSYPETNVSTARRTGSEARTDAENTESAGPEAKHKLRQMVESGKAHATEWKGRVQDGIREKPIQSVLIAAAVGAVIGVIVGRRTR